MKKLRTLGREKAFHMLYQYEMTKDDPDSLISLFWENEKKKPGKSLKSFSEELFKSALDKKSYYDDIISKYLKDDWTFDRLTEPVKNILRLGLTELFDGDAPVYAILDDYTTLAKIYEDEKAASFVNGILEKIRREFNIDRK